MSDDIDLVPTSNPNIDWAEVFVDELARCGLRHVCIAPGSRSTPLAMAFYAHPLIQIHVHLDERSAAFFALGLALAEDSPAALLCTSGTAGANFFPAVVEANMSQVPLLVLTADRPHELRHSGANQTIDQVKLYGDHVLWAVDAALPQAGAPQIALRNLRTLAARALAVSDGLRKGPVHLNFPFRKPLEPLSVDGWKRPERVENAPDYRPFTTMERGTIRPQDSQIDFLSSLISAKPQGLIICGPRCAGGTFPGEAVNLARMTGYPLLADPLSGLRFGPHTADAPVLGGYETFLYRSDNFPRPEIILRFGAVPTSKRLNQYLAGCETASQIHVRENGVWADENHMTGYFLQADAATLCSTLTKRSLKERRSRWLERWMALESKSWMLLRRALEDTSFDGAFVTELLKQLPENSTLLAGNSLPVRHVDQFGRPDVKSIQVFANRGASGIDGNISTGLGIAAGSSKQATILTGDITFYHDSNGLLALRNLAANDITFVVLNNDGGGIFRRLPVSKFEPPFNELFQTAHGLDLATIANTYGLEFQRPHNPDALRLLLASGSDTRTARLIEIRTEAMRDNEMRSNIESSIADSLLDFWNQY